MNDAPIVGWTHPGRFAVDVRRYSADAHLVCNAGRITGFLQLCRQLYDSSFNKLFIRFIEVRITLSMTIIRISHLQDRR